MNLNKIFLIGRLTQDPELRSTPNGQSVATLRMATNRVWKDQSGQKKDATEFHTVVAWGRLGEIANQYLKKGSLLMIEGRIQTRSWVDQSNNKRYMTEVIAESLQMGPRNASMGSGQAPSMDSTSPPQVGSRPGGEARSEGAAEQKKNDDNIPVINANEPVSSGVEEDEVKIKEEDLPF